MSYDIYECNKFDTARFSLGKEGEKKLFVIGLNPSTANKEKSDTTVAKVETVANNNDFDGFVMLNLYPLRSTDPKGLPEDFDQDLFNENISKIITVASKESAPVFWAAWGGDIELRPYLSKTLMELLPQIKDLGGSWVNFGKLRVDGHPRHPSRLAYAWNFSSLDMDTYVQKFA